MEGNTEVCPPWTVFQQTTECGGALLTREHGSTKYDFVLTSKNCGKKVAMKGIGFHVGSGSLLIVKGVLTGKSVNVNFDTGHPDGFAIVRFPAVDIKLNRHGVSLPDEGESVPSEGVSAGLARFSGVCPMDAKITSSDDRGFSANTVPRTGSLQTQEGMPYAGHRSQWKVYGIRARNEPRQRGKNEEFMKVTKCVLQIKQAIKDSVK